MVIMKAMGMESDQEIVQMVGRDPRYGGLLLASIQVAFSSNIITFINYLYASAPCKYVTLVNVSISCNLVCYTP